MFVGFLGLDIFKEILLPFYHEIHHDCSPPFGRISRWWFQQFSMFTPKIGEDEPIFDVYVFFPDGLVQPPTRICCFFIQAF